MPTPPFMSRRFLLRLLLSAVPATALPVRAAAPALMLAGVYSPGMPTDDWWVSEKYDGVRGYWDGLQLQLRGGGIVAAPVWFTQGWPDVPMDGELWAGRGAFAQAVSTVRQQRAPDSAWRAMRFMVFDLPAQGGVFDTRLAALRSLLARDTPAWLVPVAQRKGLSAEALQILLNKTVREGGEGLVLHRSDSAYSPGRGDDLLKLKPWHDAEARVVAYVAGKGRFEGRLGALLVETPEGKRFKLGTGFSSEDRRDPPAVGSWVAYRYKELLPSGLPRFASYLRPREDMAL